MSSTGDVTDAPVVTAPTEEPVGEDFAKAVRRNQLRGLIILLAVLGVAGTAGFLLWRSQRSLLPAPDDRAMAGLRDGLEALPKIPKGDRPALAAGMLAEFESDRVPRALREALEDFSNYGSYGGRMGSMKLLAALAERPLKDEWSMVCDRGPSVLASMIELEPSKQSLHVYDRCEFSRFELLTREEAMNADPALLAVAHVIYGILDSNRALIPEEISLLRYLSVDSREMGRADPFAGDRGPLRLKPLDFPELPPPPPED
jgi:hypothetical protein